MTQAALNNALKVVGKQLADARIVVSGGGTAGHAIIRLLKASGAQHILAAGRDGVLEPNTSQRDEHRQWSGQGYCRFVRRRGLAGRRVFWR